MQKLIRFTLSCKTSISVVQELDLSLFDALASTIRSSRQCELSQVSKSKWNNSLKIWSVEAVLLF